MSFTAKDWHDRPVELNPSPGETLAEWFTRIADYAAAHPGTLTPANAAALEDLETRLADYTDSRVAAALATIASLAPLDSPTLVGTPHAQSPPTSDDTTRIATTQWVNDAIAAISGGGGGGGGGVTPLTWTAITPHTGWSNLGGTGGYFDASWSVDDYGIVRLRGAVAVTGNWTANTVIGTLPSAARPARYVSIPVRLDDYLNDEWAVDVQIAPNGEIQVVQDLSDSANSNRTGDSFLILDPIAFQSATIPSGGGGGGGGGVTPLAWTALSLDSDWSDLYAPDYPAGWAKDDYGVVRLRGAVQRTTTWNPVGDVIATLPTGARPAAAGLLFVVWQYSNAPITGTVEVDNDGTVKLLEATGTAGSTPIDHSAATIYLDQINFTTIV